MTAGCKHTQIVIVLFTPLPDTIEYSAYMNRLREGDKESDPFPSRHIT